MTIKPADSTMIRNFRVMRTLLLLVHVTAGLLDHGLTPNERAKPSTSM